jgi:hypothetical protein
MRSDLSICGLVVNDHSDVFTVNGHGSLLLNYLMISSFSWNLLVDLFV